MDKRKLGLFVAARRKALGLTLRQVADLAGVSVPFVHDIEHGRRSTERFEEFADALQVPVLELLSAAGACPHCHGTGRA
jgi:transcriptional regulator with XRE-family HTH domain